MTTDIQLTIGRLARRAAVGIDTVRFYERRGLLPDPERTPSGYRLYPESIVDRIRFIRRAKDLGFSLDEIESLLDLHDHGGRKSTVKALTKKKLAEIDARIEDLARIRDALRELDVRCTGHGDVAGCPIIDALASEEGR